MSTSTPAYTSPARVGRMNMRRWTSTISPRSGARSWNSQVEKNFRRACMQRAPARGVLRYRHFFHELLRDFETVHARALDARHEPVPDDAGQHRLHVFGHDVLAAFHQGPGTRCVK